MAPFLPSSSPLLSFIDTGHCSVAQAGQESACRLELTVAAPALSTEFKAVIAVYSAVLCLVTVF